MRLRFRRIVFGQELLSCTVLSCHQKHIVDTRSVLKLAFFSRPESLDARMVALIAYDPRRCFADQLLAVLQGLKANKPCAINARAERVISASFESSKELSTLRPRGTRTGPTETQVQP
jgi:hypothetical protein